MIKGHMPQPQIRIRTKNPQLPSELHIYSTRASTFTHFSKLLWRQFIKFEISSLNYDFIIFSTAFAVTLTSDFSSHVHIPHSSIQVSLSVAQAPMVPSAGLTLYSFSIFSELVVTFGIKISLYFWLFIDYFIFLFTQHAKITIFERHDSSFSISRKLQPRIFRLISCHHAQREGARRSGEKYKAHSSM